MEIGKYQGNQTYEKEQNRSITKLQKVQAAV